MSDFNQKYIEADEYLRDAVLKILAENCFEQSSGFAMQVQADLFFVDKQKKMLAVECRQVAFYRSASFRALIGDAILRFQHAKLHGEKARLMLAILIKRMSANAEDDLKEYARQFEPELNWLVLAEDGRGFLRLNGVDQSVALPPFRNQKELSGVPSPAGLFSPKNQWLLKLSLMPGIDCKYWSGPERRPRSVGELADVSGVSQSSVSQFVGKAESSGFLRRVAGGLVMVNHRELLEDWSYALKHRPPKVVNARPLYGPESEEKWLARLRDYCAKDKESPPFAVGSHLACHLLGAGRSSNRQAILHVRQPMESIMKALNLVEDEGDAPAIRLVEPAFPEGVLRSCVFVQGVPVADLLQCYLDVRVSPARGLEQADYIYQRILARHFEGG